MFRRRIFLKNNKNTVMNGSNGFKVENFSYLKGDTVDPLKGTIGHFFAMKTREIPYVNAVRSSSQRLLWSFNTLKNHSDAFGCGLLDLGARPGDRIGLIQGNNAEQLVVTLSAAKIGASVVEFRNVKTAKDLGRYMELFRPRILIMPTKFGKTDLWSFLYEIVPEIELTEQGAPVRSKKYPFCKHIIITDPTSDVRKGVYLFKSAFVYGPFGFYENPLRRVSMNIKPDDPALILLDNEDVNKAKPIVYTHENLLNTGLFIGRAVGIQQGDRVMVPSAQNTVMGSILSNYSTLVNSATLIIPSETFNAGETLKYMGQDQATVLFATTSELKELSQHPDITKYNYGSLRHIVTNSSISPEIQREVEKSFAAKVHKLTGVDEASGVIQIDDKILPNTEMKIIRPKDGRILEREVNGYLKVKGPSVAKGVWMDIGFMNDKIDEDGFLLTNKVALIDKQDRLIIG